ncbi:MAG: ACP S-malonyltransferase, partial [Betaproteobacteria bacterium]|nr:ACP S-malonyltransferase [Betaproteobacteria bacterium]
ILKTNLWKMIVEGPAESLAQTINTQPVMLAAGVATYRAWQAQGGAVADYYAGHSLGEYTALVAAGAISFADAIPLVRFRAEAMQAAVPEGVGAIAAILGLEAAQIQSVCADAVSGEYQGEVLEAVNLNSPGQIVIAGHKSAVERGMVLAKERGAKRALLLPMSVPSHCALMRPAAERLAEYLKGVTVNVPKMPVIQNADVSAFCTADKIRKALVEQLYRPVRWIETVQSLASQGVGAVIECVPGKILTGLNKRIDGDLNCLAITDSNSLIAAVGAVR